MAHIRSNKAKLIARVRKLQGQLEAVIRGIETGENCFKVLQTASACRGGFASLVRELLDDHIRSHFAEAKSLREVKAESRELTRILRTYLK